MRSSSRLLTVLWRLPLFDDLYLSMQAQNIAVVDTYLEGLEGQLLALLIDRERTPGLEMLFVSAMCQMWVFAVYELLRTWRQRVQELLKFGDELHELKPRQRRRLVAAKIEGLQGMTEDGPGVAMRRRGFKRVATKSYYERLQKAWDKVEPVFHRIEAFRVTLAKHEVPKTKSVPAYSPGYGRIHPLSGSIAWQIELKDGTVDFVSRQGLADDIRALGARKPKYASYPAI